MKAVERLRAKGQWFRHVFKKKKTREWKLFEQQRRQFDLHRLGRSGRQHFTVREAREGLPLGRVE